MQAPALRDNRDKIPAGLLRAIFLLVLCSLAVASYASFTGTPPAASPSPSAVLAERSLVILSRPDGGARVLDADGAVIAERGAGEAGFISGVGRAMNRVRQVAGVPFDAPATLSLHRDGSLRLTDPQTGWRVQLKAFGKDNEAAFAALLPPPPAKGDTE